MPEQSFDVPHVDGDAPGADAPRGVGLWRAVAFSPAMAATAGLVWLMYGWFADQGISSIEIILLTLIAFNFFWIAFTVSTTLLGVISLARPGRLERTEVAKPLNVALLVPVYNEEPWFVLGNARSMLEELRARGGAHRYAMFILSDTRDDTIAAEEQAGVEALRAEMPGDIALYYRRREQNTDKKVGNIADWVSRWGADWDGMLVLDADSLMTGRAIVRLADALSRDNTAGLIQSFPQLIGGQSVFARMQQFANGVYGAAFAEGLARWCGAEGNYWGHNAIIRTRAFAACAGLPRLRSLLGRETTIMSHDFVEAGLLRRAGWGVRFLPRIRGSFEESPATLIDHIQRDRRWCQGNMQHLSLLRTRGMRAVSRFHLFHGAIGYLMSPIWFSLLVMWALIGRGEEASVLTYFSETNPLFPTWPEMTEGKHVLIIILMYATLLAPKILGALALRLTGARFADFGGPMRFAGAFFAEIALSVLYAPILMVQQMVAVLRTFLGIQRGWNAPARAGGKYSLWTLLRCHALEEISGIVLMTGIVTGFVSLWLLPIAVSLVLAVPLSAISGWSIKTLVRTSEDYAAPQITRAAHHYRTEMKALTKPLPKQVSPAE